MADINALLYLGILLPTAITVGVFIGFLVCWFRCSLRERLTKQRNASKPIKHTCGVEDGAMGEQMEKASQHSIDSAIDVREPELAVADDRNSLTNDSVTIPHTQKPVVETTLNNVLQTSATVEADVHSLRCLSRGSYPSYEKLDDEINSQPRIYEMQEEIESVISAGSRNPSTDQQYSAAGWLHRYRDVLTRTSSTNQLTVHNCIYHSSHSDRNTDSIRDQKSDYVARQSSSVTSVQGQGYSGSYRMPLQIRDTDLKWKPHVTSGLSESYPIEIIHV